ncbi:MAG: LuxR C-terminal-related transcriptional regulator [Blastocatellia bacterium]|nr:LuxR C-terminal-related transcriptional regulator [Blastocatellia bacterium]
MVTSTSDPAFAVDGQGRVAAWNRGAEELFGIPGDEAMGKPCGELVKGTDECGPVCSENCCIQQAVHDHHPVGNFDIQVETREGKKWCNVSVLTLDEDSSTRPYALHIIREIDMRKRLEVLMREFIVKGTDLPEEASRAIRSTTRAPARDADLTEREIEILRLLAEGETTVKVAEKLHISRVTVNNHIQHIYRKLDVHTRLEAIRRAEIAGLI